MTAEIAVMNKTAVALAADSAATLEMEKVHKIYMVNKLFALSERHEVGIMIYGIPELLGVPWETIIKMYREKLGTKKFRTMKEYSKDLISFIENDKVLFPEVLQKRYFRESLFIYYNQINKGILENVKSYTKKKKITKTKTSEIVESLITKHCLRFEKQDKLANVSSAWVARLIKKYAATISKVKKAVFVKLPISASANAKLKKIAGFLFSKDVFRGGLSGLVVAGFGNDDIFPHVISFEIEGVIYGKAKYKSGVNLKIDENNDASIVPFAQRDMVQSFMEGVHPDYFNYLFEGLSSLLMKKYPDKILAEIKDLSKKKRKSVASKLEEINKGILDEYKERLQSHSYKKHIRPIIRAVSHLPKDELAEMAETLISLISFRKRMSVDATETVGGPVDVAVISKGDGFIWIKRKLYFEHEHNPHLRGN